MQRRPFVSAQSAAGSFRLAWALIVIGGGLRIAQYASGRSLWLDESYLALNVLTHSYRGLVGTLDYQQGAPPGFLLATKLLVGTFGSSEMILRAIPLAAGLVSLALFHKLARLTLAPWAANIALALFAVSGGLISYSSEFKPYEVDVAATLLIVWLATALWRRGLKAREGTLLGLAGLVAISFSYAAVFALGAVVVAILTRVVAERRRDVVAGIASAFAIWLVACGTVYFLFVPNIRSLQHQVFDAHYLPLPPSSFGDVRQYAAAAKSLFTGSVALDLSVPIAAIAATLAVLGPVSLAKRRPFGVLVWVSLFALVLIASGLDRYPWGGRFTLFLVPYVLLAAAAGIVWIAEAGRGARFLAAPLAVCLLATPMGRAAYRLFQPRTIEEMKPIVRHLANQWRPGDTLYLNAGAQYAFRYYSQYRAGAVSTDGRDVPWPIIPAPGGPLGTSPALRSRSPQLIVGSAGDQNAQRLLARVANLIAHGDRVWVLLDHLPTAERNEFPQRLRGATLTVSDRQPGVALYLYAR